MTGVPTQRDGAHGPDTNERLAVTLARLEGKVDVALAQHGASIAAHDREIIDHETRIRAVEAKVPDRLNDRLQAVEGRSTVTWKQLWAAVGSAAAAIAALSPLLERLYSLHP